MNILICYNFRIYIKVLKDFKKGVNIQFYIYFYVRIGGVCVSFKFKDWEQLFGKPLACSAKRNFQLQILRNFIKKYISFCLLHKIITTYIVRGQDFSITHDLS